MAMTFEQYMVRLCREMYIKFKFIVFIFLLLPLLILSSNVRKRRRPGLDEQSEDSKESYPDQVALATNYRQPDYGSSQGYLENESSDNRHDLIKKPAEEGNTENPRDKFFEENLANTNSAQEYVEKALQLHINHGGPNLNTNIGTKSQTNPQINIIPNSSSPKYEVYEGGESQTETPTQFFNKESVTRSSYDLLDYNDDEFHKPHHQYSSYSTGHYEPINFDGIKYNPHEDSKRQEDHIQASPSELPKEEILRHIEESVIKYMKTLEAEGKIPTQEPKIHYKIQHPSIAPGKSYGGLKHKEMISESETGIRLPRPTPTTAVKILLNEEPIYQARNPTKETMHNLPENVEFIYKINTRSPANKYKNGPPLQKMPDHSTAVKHFQDFDLSQVIQEERPTKARLYFNAETYKDINSLPYKPEKILFRQEHKEREQGRPVVEYKTFSTQPDTGANQFIPLTEHQSNQGVDDGYPGLNSYRYMLNKEPPPKYEPENGLAVQPSNWQPYSPNKDINPLQYDSYNPKYNNNPEGFGYQHSYKQPEGHSAYTLKSPSRSPKRGKRGHSKKPGRHFTVNKDPEANVALRPPPKGKQS